jgi:hypothetical protein
MIKKLLILLFVLSITLVGCSSEESSRNDSAEKVVKNEEKAKNAEVLSKEEFEKMYTNPKEYKGSVVEFFAKIFVEPEKDSDGTYLQAYVDNNSDRNIIIAIKDPNLDVKSEDIIIVKGTVNDVFEGENLMGGKITAPMILADSIEKSDYASAFAPSLKTVDINQEIDQHGYLLKVNKMEVAANETRFYISIQNNTQSTISFYDFNSKLIVENKQLETKDNFDSDYPELQSDILPGIVTEGIIVFPSVAETGNVKLYLEGSSEDWDLDLNPFQFEIAY